MAQNQQAVGRSAPFVMVQSPPIIGQRAPSTSDTNYPKGATWLDESVSPPVIYDYLGSGIWGIGGNSIATTTEPGIVLIDTTVDAADTDAEVPTAKAVYDYGQSLVLAGANIASEVAQGIAFTASDAQCVGNEPNTLTEAYMVSPDNLIAIFAEPNGPIGGTTPVAGTFTDLTADGSGTVSLGANAASNVTVTGAFDLTLASTAGSLVVNAGEAAADAIDLNAASGGFDVDVALLAAITSTRNNAQAILLESTAGGIDILASGSGGAGEDIDIICTGGSVNISGTENAADAVTIAAANGGIDITCGGAAGEDIDIVNTAGSININAGEAVADAINVDSSGGIDVDAAGVINIASSANGASAVVVTASAGGVDITATGATAGEDINITATGSSVNVTSTENAALAVYLHADGGTSETIRLRSDQGTGVASIDVLSDVGGITLTAGLNTADAINMVCSNAAGGIDIDAGTNGFIVDTTGAISLDAAAASNFTATGAFDVTVSSTAGSINISGGEAAADAVNIDAATGGLDVDVALQMNLDSSQAAATAVRINASDAAGGIDVDCGTGGIAIDSTGAFSIDGAAASNVTTTGAGVDLTLSSVLGSVLVRSTEDAALAIRLHANGGTSETIQIHSDQGTGVGSVNLLSDVGGITLTSTGLASADAINLEAAAGGIDVDAALQINIASSQNAADAVRILASAGGIDIDAVGAAGEDIVVTNTGGSISIVATESASDAVVIQASGAAGGIQLNCGTGDVTVTGGDLILGSVASQIQMNGGAVTDFIGTSVLTAGTVTIANTNISASDRIFISRTAVNASTTLGELLYTISAGASFTVTSVVLGTPGSTETGDVSSFSYFIVRQF